MSVTRLPVRRPPWARALHRWRRDREETQASLAARLNCSVAWLSHLETGYRRPTPATREALRAVGFVSDLDVRHQVEVVEAVAVPVATVDPDDEPLGSWA